MSKSAAEPIRGCRLLLEVCRSELAGGCRLLLELILIVDFDWILRISSRSCRRWIGLLEMGALAEFFFFCWGCFWSSQNFSIVVFATLITILPSLMADLFVYFFLIWDNFSHILIFCSLVFPYKLNKVKLPYYCTWMAKKPYFWKIPLIKLNLVIQS